MFSPKSQVLSGSSTILPLVELPYVKEALGFPGSSVVKNLPTNTGDTGLPGLGRSLEGGMTIDSGTLPWEIHGQRNLRCYSPKDCKRVGHDLVTKKQGSTKK